MPRTASINIRIEPEVKNEAEELYNSFGISLSDAINIFLKKSINEGGLPFELKKEKPTLNLSKLVFSNEPMTSEKALSDVTPIEWDKDILNGKRKVIF